MQWAGAGVRCVSAAQHALPHVFRGDPIAVGVCGHSAVLLQNLRQRRALQLHQHVTICGRGRRRRSTCCTCVHRTTAPCPLSPPSDRLMWFREGENTVGEAAAAGAPRGEGVGTAGEKEAEAEGERGCVLVDGDGRGFGVTCAGAGCTTMPAGASSSFDDSNHSANRSSCRRRVCECEGDGV